MIRARPVTTVRPRRVCAAAHRYTDRMRPVAWILIVLVLISTVWMLLVPFVAEPHEHRTVSTAGIDGTDRSERLARLSLILDRLNHLEEILSSSLFTLMITTTLAMSAGAYAIRERKIPISGRVFFVGANCFYIVLSAHFYFMLTHFYSSFIFLVDQYQRMVPRLTLLWTVFRIPLPGTSDKAQSVLYLIQATLAPLLFSSLAALGLYWVFLHPKQIIDSTGAVISNPDRSDFTWIVLALLLHVFVWVVMIWQPFWDFMNALHAKVPVQ